MYKPLYEVISQTPTIRLWKSKDIKMIDLPQEVQEVLNQQQQQPSPAPIIAGTTMPLPPNAAQGMVQSPNAVSAPAITPPSAPGSLADKIASAYLEHLAKNQPQPVRPKPQQTTGQQVIGAAQGVMGALGDA